MTRCRSRVWPATLFALTVAAAIGAGFLPAAATHRNRR